MMILTVRNFARKCFPDGEDDGRANRRRVFLRRAIIGAVALVVAVACSRLLLGLHYPTDVIISATICPLISYAVWCVWNACESAGSGKIVRWVDVVDQMPIPNRVLSAM